MQKYTAGQTPSSRTSVPNKNKGNTVTDEIKSFDLDILLTIRIIELIQNRYVKYTNYTCGRWFVVRYVVKIMRTLAKSFIIHWRIYKVSRSVRLSNSG